MGDLRKPVLGLIQDDVILMTVAGSLTRQRRCKNCHGTPPSCNDSGCGQRKPIGWRRVPVIHHITLDNSSIDDFVAWLEMLAARKERVWSLTIGFDELDKSAKVKVDGGPWSRPFKAEFESK